MPKVFLERDPIEEFTMHERMDYDRVLRSADRREEFLLTLERGRRRRIRLKYQTRARRVIVLARLELNGPRHKNPADSPYKPGQWMGDTHLHLYREGFDDRIAYELTDVPTWTGVIDSNGVAALESFMNFCAIIDWPPIQTSL